MESEFRVKNPTPAPGYAQAVISALRQTRKEHPLADAAAGLVPGVGVGQGAMDATDPDSSDFQRMLAVASILPGMRLARTIVGRLRGAKTAEKLVEHYPKTPSTTPPSAVAEANRQYAEQLLKEGGDIDSDYMARMMERVRAL